jgi:hypothetical protein
MATLTIEIPAPLSQRLSVAYGKLYNLKDEEGEPRDATMTDIELYVKSELRRLVIIQERKEAEKAIAASDFNIP